MYKNVWARGRHIYKGLFRHLKDEGSIVPIFFRTTFWRRWKEKRRWQDPCHNLQSTCGGFSLRGQSAKVKVNILFHAPSISGNVSPYVSARDRIWSQTEHSRLKMLELLRPGPPPATRLHTSNTVLVSTLTTNTFKQICDDQDGDKICEQI